MKKFLISITLVALITTGAFCGGKAEPGAAANAGATAGAKIEIRAAHGAAENTAVHLGWLKFKEEIEKNSGGRITVSIFPNQQLGGDREYSESVQMGDLTAGSPSSTPIAAFVKELFVLDIPFLFTDRDSTYAILDGEPGKALNKSMEAAGFKNLGYFENGFRNFSNSRNAVHKADDIKGLKLRTMENPIHMEFWRLAGANPTPMAYGELFTALQQKTVDAQENPFELIYTSKFYEVQNYISETQHIYTPYLILFNLAWWNNQSAQDQTLIQNAINIAVKECRTQAANLDVAAKDAIVKAGVKVDPLTAQEKQAFRQVMSPVLAAVKARAGDAIVEVFTTAAKY
jgi:tripartite ATP-independent transporter DctP family solute receptor